jgi:hypothetical protein
MFGRPLLFLPRFFQNKASTSRSRPRSFRPSHITLLRFIQLARRVESRYNNSVGNGFMCSFLRLVILMCHIVFLVHWVWVVRMLYQPSAKRKKAVLPCIVFRHLWNVTICCITCSHMLCECLFVLVMHIGNCSGGDPAIQTGKNHP